MYLIVNYEKEVIQSTYGVSYDSLHNINQYSYNIEGIVQAISIAYRLDEESSKDRFCRSIHLCDCEYGVKGGNREMVYLEE
jgi:hypothetical protein